MAIRVVLADDHILVRQSLKSLLEREGFKVVAEASDGQEALRQVQSHQPDVAVIDISMPVLNGLDAARRLYCGGAGVPHEIEEADRPIDHPGETSAAAHRRRQIHERRGIYARNQCEDG